MATELRWKGLFTDADPMDIPPGASVEQTNLTCVTPGKLTPRKGFRAFTFEGVEPTCDTLPTAMYRMRTVNGDSTAWQSGTRVYIAGADGQQAAIETGIDDTSPSCFSQTRKGWLIRVSGRERGTVLINGTSYPLGISPPSSSPTVTVAGGGGAYEATYWCGYRYRDDNDCYSSLSPLTEVEASENSMFRWKTPPDSDEARVTAIELYRSIADDPQTLFLVATLDNDQADSVDRITVRDWEFAGEELIHLVGATPVALPSGTKLLFCGPPSSSGTQVEVTVAGGHAAAATALAVQPLTGSIPQFSWASVTGTGGVVYEDKLSDDSLLERAALPVLYSDGALCARRFEPPPENMAVCMPFQDRMFFAAQPGESEQTDNRAHGYIYVNGVLTPLDEHGEPVYATSTADDRNVLYYSEPDEYESVPRSQNVLIVQEDADDADRITALLSHGGNLYIGKDRHLYRVNYSFDPRIDGSCRLVCKRGVLHQRAFGYVEDTCYLLDQLGAWQLSGDGIRSISEPIQNYWREGLIDFSRRERFFVSVEPNESVVRFHMLFSDDPEDTTDRDYYPTRALCYSARTNAWWEEEYPIELGAACRMEKDGRIRTIVGSKTGQMLLASEGVTDLKQLEAWSTLIDTPIEYSLRTGFLKLPYTETDRGTGKVADYQIITTFTPTTEDESIALRMYWDHDTNAITWTGHTESNTVAVRDSTDFVISMQKQVTNTATNRGWERWPFNFRSDPKVITHHCLTIELDGTVKKEAHTIHDVMVETRR